MKENHGLNLGQLIFHLNLSQISNHDHMRISYHILNSRHRKVQLHRKFLAGCPLIDLANFAA